MAAYVGWLWIISLRSNALSKREASSAWRWQEKMSLSGVTPGQSHGEQGVCILPRRASESRSFSGCKRGQRGRSQEGEQEVYKVRGGARQVEWVWWAVQGLAFYSGWVAHLVMCCETLSGCSRQCWRSIEEGKGTLPRGGGVWVAPQTARVWNDSENT